MPSKPSSMLSRQQQRQLPMSLPRVIREITETDLRAAYERCVSDKKRLSFEVALTSPVMAIVLRNAAKAAIAKKRGL